MCIHYNLGSYIGQRFCHAAYNVNKVHCMQLARQPDSYHFYIKCNRSSVLWKCGSSQARAYRLLKEKRACT